MLSKIKYINILPLSKTQSGLSLIESLLTTLCFQSRIKNIDCILSPGVFRFIGEYIYAIYYEKYIPILKKVEVPCSHI